MNVFALFAVGIVALVYVCRLVFAVEHFGLFGHVSVLCALTFCFV